MDKTEYLNSKEVPKLVESNIGNYCFFQLSDIGSAWECSCAMKSLCIRNFWVMLRLLHA